LSRKLVLEPKSQKWNTLKEALINEKQSRTRHCMRETGISTKQALKISRKHALYRTWILQSVGEYYWLAGKQSKALSWWNKTIKEEKALGAKMDLSLAYFEVGKRLMESHSKHKEMNGIDGGGFLEKARILFEEMGLERNLGELERIDQGA